MNKKEKFGRMLGPAISTAEAFALAGVVYLLFESSSVLAAVIAAILAVVVLSEFIGGDKEFQNKNDNL